MKFQGRHWLEDFAWRVEPAWKAWHKNSGYRGVCNFLSVLSLLCVSPTLMRAETVPSVIRYRSIAFKSYWALYRMSHAAYALCTLNDCSLSALAWFDVHHSWGSIYIYIYTGWAMPLTHCARSLLAVWALWHGFDVPQLWGIKGNYI
jgi:hypothetical protein